MSEALRLDENLTMEELLSLSVELKNQIDELQNQKSTLTKKREAINAVIFEQMDAAGVSSTGSTVGTAIITESLKPRITDKEAFFEYVKTENALDLLPSSITASTYREYTEAGIELPGTTHYVKRDVRVSRRRG